MSAAGAFCFPLHVTLHPLQNEVDRFRKSAQIVGADRFCRVGCVDIEALKSTVNLAGNLPSTPTPKMLALWAVENVLYGRDEEGE
jgi:hypothetical protein